MNDHLFKVVNIQRICVNDGPGVRTVVFLKGCTLHCPWCCNPESIRYSDDLIFNTGKCYNFNNEICSHCEINGGRNCKTKCPYNAYKEVYEDFTVKELYDILLKDKYLFADGGGVTFSGGEPLVYANLLVDLLNKLKKDNINIAVETSLYINSSLFDKVFSLVDHWIIDLKFQKTGFVVNKEFSIPPNDFDKNLLKLKLSSHNILFRLVVLPELLENIDDLILKLNNYSVSSLELLPYHSLAKNKYQRLGLNFKNFEKPSVDFLSHLKDELNKYNIKSKCLSL